MRPLNSPEGMPAPATFKTRQDALQLRVNDAAGALRAQGIRPTVARIRAALGGGSPNDLTPALNHWRRGSDIGGVGAHLIDTAAVPGVISDLVRELWQRATAAALIELRNGPRALERIEQGVEVRSLREQVALLRAQLDRESIAYGELRAQAARHEAIAKQALDRVREVEARERLLVRELGEVTGRLASAAAMVETDRPSRRRKPRRTVAKKRPAAAPRTDRAKKTVSKRGASGSKAAPRRVTTRKK
jgi:Plasmid replication region DNA-binding N-term